VLDEVQLRAAMRAHRVTAVMHFAASAYVGDSMRCPAHYYRNNLSTTLALLDAMLECGVTDLVFSSSCAVYGNPATVPIDESHMPAPLSPYGQTKLDAENAVRWYSRAYGLRSIALRYFNAAGADPDGETGEDHDPETRLVPRAIFAATGRGPPLEVYGDDWPTRDGTAIRDYVHVADLADAHVAALRVLPRDSRGEPLNLGTGRGSSVREVIDAVSRATGRTVPHIVAARRDGDPAEVVAAPARAERLLAWSARRSSIDEIVRAAVRWHARVH
jgi:UDP-glucose-4-epimerase GalE